MKTVPNQGNASPSSSAVQWLRDEVRAVQALRHGDLASDNGAEEAARTGRALGAVTRTPVLPLPIAAVPAALVPTKLPWMTRLRTESEIPSSPLPEMTLPAPAVAPPIV